MNGAATDGVSDGPARQLEAAFRPERLEVIDESEEHRGHAGWHEGGGTHFRVVMRAASLDGLSRVERSRAVHRALQPEFAPGCTRWRSTSPAARPEARLRARRPVRAAATGAAASASVGRRRARERRLDAARGSRPRGGARPARAAPGRPGALLRRAPG